MRRQMRAEAENKMRADLKKYDALDLKRMNTSKSDSSARGHLEHQMNLIAAQLRKIYKCEYSGQFSSCNDPRKMKCCPGKKYMYTEYPDYAFCMNESYSDYFKECENQGV